jgi:hypothetical protein
MKLYRLKDTIAIFWFFILIILQYKKRYTLVIILLSFGMLADLFISVTDIGELEVNTQLSSLVHDSE